MHKCGDNVIPQRLIQPRNRFVVMSPKKKETKIRGFRPPMDEASDPSHDSHVKRIREQEKT
jgi:hypothetical protein